ncbi:hypothetical protein BH23BAC4_BH23BAC4_00980 [soil metagenome]
MRSTIGNVGIVHGYGLSGSGSNLWTRAVLRALCRLGRDVHVVCQEGRPEKFEFVTRAISYDDAGRPTELFVRETDYPGSCTVHRPDLAVLPVYVAPRTTSTYIRPIPDLDDAAIRDYVDRNARVLQHVARHHGVSSFHVNHVVLMSAALQQTHREAGIPYAVLPHGSAIEYVVRRDERMMRAAGSALADAGRVLALNGEMEGRMEEVFGEVPGLLEKMERLPVGVDTEQFDSAAPEERESRLERLLAFIEDEPRGRTPAQQTSLADRLSPDLDDDALLATLREGAVYTSSAPDAELEPLLRAPGWRHAPIVTYVGRLIAAKGADLAVAAFPLILRDVPDARLIIAGTGALREALEALTWALAHGHADLARRIARVAARLEDDSHGKSLEHLQAFFARLDREDGWDEYLTAARGMADPNRVTFTGFVDHGPLSQLYSIADVGLFPSVVKEASPLVVPECAASGTLPIGTNHAGMGDSLRTLGASLPEEARRLLEARFDPEHTVHDLAANAVEALKNRGRWTESLRTAALERYDWRTIAQRLAGILDELADQQTSSTD